ncbi:MAG TPA: AsmA family protein, partial [Rhodanobacteraceae bacterium]|nr:AsmA family protein [Rhodanobacteraceae bacterium]
MGAVRKTFIWLIGIVLGLIVAAILFVTFFDWNRARPWVDGKVSAAIGRPFAINGDLSVHWARNPGAGGISSWVPWPRFTARDVTVANPGWAKAKQFATLQQIQFSVSPLALVGHTIDIPTLQLTHPDVDIERDASGRANWDFAFGNSPGSWNLQLGNVAFDRGTVHVDDRVLDLRLDVAVEPLGKPIPFHEIAASHAPGGAPARSDQSYHFGWTAHGTWRGAVARGSGKLGSVLAVRDASMPFPLQADLKLRDLHIALEGTLTDPAHLAALDLRLKMSGANMAHLYALTGVTLPDTPPFSTDGHLTGNLHPGHSVFHYRDFNGRVGASDLHGTMTFTTAPPRPKLSGTLTSNRLRFSDLAPLVGAGGAKKSDVAVQQPPDKLLPVAPFLTDRWKAMDADVHFTGEHIVRKAQLPISHLSTHLMMDAGVLTLDPLRFGVAGGDLDASIRLDGSADPMKGRMKIALRGAELKKLFPTVDLMQTSLGEINGDAALSGTGNSVAKLLGTSDGEVKLLMDNGVVSKLLLEEAGLNLANIAALKLFGDKPEKINCVAA